MAAKEITAKIIQRKSLTHDVIEFVLEPEEKVAYVAGQYIMIKVPTENGKFSYRAYSIANHPSDREKNLIRLLVKFLPSGAASEYLKGKKNGETIQFRGGLGFFTFKSAGVQNVYFICTGTGIAPLTTMIEEELQRGSKSHFKLFFGNRFKVDIFWDDYLQNLFESHTNFNYQLILSRPVGYWDGPKGYVTELLKNPDLDLQNGHFYICGHPQMVEDAKKILLDKDVDEARIFEEKFVSVGKALKEKD